MKFEDYFDAIDLDSEGGNLSDLLYVPSDTADLDETNLVIFSVPESRYGDNTGEINLHGIISALSNLNIHGQKLKKVAVLGSLKVGKSLHDTEAAVSQIVEELLSKRVTPLILSSSREITYGVYQAFKSLEEVVNVASIDWKLNVESTQEAGFVGKIIKEQPSFLFNYSCLGYQTYHVSPEELSLADELYFDVLRLGELRGDIYKAEPIIRGSEVISVSMEALKASDYESSQNPQPNGFYAEEICQCVRYAGLSEKLKVLLITDINLLDKSSDQLLIAEMIWCLLDGLYARFSEIPNARNSQYLKYRVAIKDDEFQLVFYKSLKTDRWWMEVPVPPQYSNKYRKQHLIPCDYDDYKTATNDDLPDRWWKAYKKLL
jgi:formiminoglutamase